MPAPIYAIGDIHGQREMLGEALERIDAPIGLDIGAATPAEIAVAVLGAVIRALRTRGLQGGSVPA